jgi:hypothetical protein
MRFLARVRGRALRLSRNRPLAACVGFALAVPAVWIEWSGRFDVWWAQGVTLVAGATGIALLWTAITGARPDWTE